MTSRVHRVEVAGCRAGVGDLTWGQVATFRDLDEDHARPGHAAEPVRVSRTLPPVDLADVLEAVRLVLIRHDALRTRFFRAADGRWRQEHLPAAALDVLEVATEDAIAPGDEPVDEAAVRAADDLASTPFEDTETPFRVAVLTRSGKVCAVACAMHALVVDGIAAHLVLDELRRLSTEPAAPVDTDAWSPSDIAGLDCSEEGRRAADRADAHFRRTVLTVAPVPPPVVDGQSRAALAWAVRNSAAAAAAVRVLSERDRTSPASVLLAGYAVVAARRLGRDDLPLSIACANRVDPRFATSVTNLTQFAPALVRVAGTFPQMCAHASAVSMRTYRYGRHDPRLRRAMLREVGAERWPRYSVNLRLIGQSTLDGELGRATDEEFRAYAGLRADDLRALCAASTGRSGATAGLPPSPKVRFTVWSVGSVAGMMLMGDQTAIDPAGPAELLSALEALLVEAACAEPDVDVEVLAGRVEDSRTSSARGRA